jgi:hypothetical protein
MTDGEYGLTADDAYKMELEAEDRQHAIKDLLDNWKHDHSFMFVKPEDDEGWTMLVQRVLQA